MLIPKVTRHVNGGIQKIFIFENGFGASVVKHNYSYGGNNGLWELAVLEDISLEPLKFKITYDTPITNDVLGYMTDEDVESTLMEIGKLKGQKGEPS